MNSLRDAGDLLKRAETSLREALAPFRPMDSKARAEATLADIRAALALPELKASLSVGGGEGAVERALAGLRAGGAAIVLSGTTRGDAHKTAWDAMQAALNAASPSPAAGGRGEIETFLSGVAHAADDDRLWICNVHAFGEAQAGEIRAGSLRAALPPSPAPSEPSPASVVSVPEGWRDISTAPKDGACVLLGWKSQGSVTIGRWHSDGWANQAWRTFWTAPTHWQPRPEPPK